MPQRGSPGVFAERSLDLLCRAGIKASHAAVSSPAPQAGAAALTVAGFGFNALKFSPTRGGPLYATGYNDDFWKYAQVGGADASLPFQQVKGGGGQYSSDR